MRFCALPVLLALCACEVGRPPSAVGDIQARSTAPTRATYAPASEPIVNDKTKFSPAAYGPASERVTRSRHVPRGGGRRVLGKPYRINGRRYVPKLDRRYSKTGIASWYGPNFHGRRTANGEIYDQFALSAAHPTMPLPSYARVTNLANGRSLIVRINDRGPYASGRIVDLSGAAAERLGYRKDGLAKVHVRYVGPAALDARDTAFMRDSFRIDRTVIKRSRRHRFSFFRR